MLQSKNFMLVPICFLVLAASGCQQQTQIAAPVDKQNTEVTSPTTTSSPDVTVQPTSVSQPKKISSKEDGIPFNPMINGQYAIWQQTPDINQEKIGLNLYDLTLNRHDLPGEDLKNMEKVARVNIKKGAATLSEGYNESYIVWMEASGSATAGKSNLYYSPLGGKLQKNLVAEYPAYFQFNAGASAKYYYLDGDKLYYLSEDLSQTGTWKIFDLVENKQTGEFSIASLQEKYHSNLLFLGVYNRAYYYFAEGHLIGINIADGQQYLDQILNIPTPFGSYIQFSQGKLAWAEGIDSKVIIHGFDPVTKNQVTIAELPVSIENFMGFGITSDRLIWGALISKDSNEANLFIKKSEGGDVINVLGKSGIHLSSTLTKSFNFPRMISDKNVIFPGYEGDLKDDFSNVGLYLVTIP